MSTKVRPIADPEDKKGKPIELPPKMKMRNIETYEGKQDGKPVKQESLKSMVSDDKVKNMKRIGGKDSPIECIKLAELVLESIESIENHKGFTIGKEANKLYCGHVIQRIPMGAYARIGGGQSVYALSPPVEKGKKLTFNFDKKRQLAIKVGNNVGKDWVVVVAGNGCIFLDTASYASFHLPMYIVEQTGDYYKVDSGNRILLLGTGHHLMFYTKETPILFVRKHTVTHQKSIPVSALPKDNSLKSNSLASNEPLDQMAKENKQVLKKIASEQPNKNQSKEESKKKEPKKEESKKEAPKEEPKKEAPKKEAPKKEAPKKEAPKITIDEVVKSKSKEKLEPLAVTPPKVDDSKLKSSEAKEIRGLSEAIVKKQKPKPFSKTTAPKSSDLIEPGDHDNGRGKKYALLFGLILLLLLVLYILYRYFSGDSHSTVRSSQNRNDQGKHCRICHTHLL